MLQVGMICAGCFQAYTGSHNCKPIDTVFAAKERHRLGGHAKAMEYFEGLERLNTPAQPAIPKPVMRPVSVDATPVDATDTGENGTVTSTDVDATEVFIPGTQEVKPEFQKTIKVGADTLELLEQVLEERRQKKMKVRDRMRRYRKKLKEKNADRDS